VIWRGKDAGVLGIPQIEQATAALKKAKVLPPFPIQVLNK
jgi:hypothetical protein